MKLCTDCPKRETCKRLGPEAEAYVNQDSKGRHVRRSRMDVEQMPDSSEIEMVAFRGLHMGLYEKLSPQQKIIVAYRLEGHSIRSIAKLMGVSKSTIQGYMERIKEKYQGEEE